MVSLFISAGINYGNMSVHSFEVALSHVTYADFYLTSCLPVAAAHQSIFPMNQTINQNANIAPYVASESEARSMFLF